MLLLGIVVCYPKAHTYVTRSALPNTLAAPSSFMNRSIATRTVAILRGVCVVTHRNGERGVHVRVVVRDGSVGSPGGVGFTGSMGVLGFFEILTRHVVGVVDKTTTQSGTPVLR